MGHVEAIIEKNVSACEWLLHYLAQEGLQYMRTLLLECDAREVRINFSNMVRLKLFCLKNKVSNLCKLKGSEYLTNLIQWGSE